ncbi:cytochrome P450 [Mycolicibacterium sp. D5.8-2]|uniref:cytochrome P450 n=1 Tax=Mycolicibacterium sp. D5.8-2 TaxID=3085903 RepID=UPI00298C272A|nr:cytochrome P450 [Mycolicibacterium sp. D5.8-2]MDW5609719.1 cytochrome P450 [Mycolicibacterium sp. D5.8-2]
MTTGVDPTFDFVDPDLLQRELPLTQLAYLRQVAPVWWSEQVGGSQFGDDGYWVISRHADVATIFPNSAQWSSQRTGAIIRLPAVVGPEQRGLLNSLIVNLDPPDHTRLRKLVSRAFTPRAVTTLEERLAATAQRIVAEAVAGGGGDFVADVAAVLPAMAIADLIGVPEEDRDTVSGWINAFSNADDPQVTDGGDVLEVQAQFAGYAFAMAEQRRERPQDDIVTRLVQPDSDGDVLDDTEFTMFLILLAVAGSETSRNAITNGMNAFLEFPDQWELFKKERPAITVEEILRWSTPVHCIQRTATADIPLHDVTIHEGDRVGLFLSSANYDETVFDDPFRFDIRRNPNPHLTFGGHGIHYCLGANLARLEIRLMFDEIARQAPRIRKVAEPQRVRSGWINGVNTFEVDYGTR